VEQAKSFMNSTLCNVIVCSKFTNQINKSNQVDEQRQTSCAKKGSECAIYDNHYLMQ